MPERADSLRRAIGEAHRRYTRRINFREGWRGHLWEGRFASFPMDDALVRVKPVLKLAGDVPWLDVLGESVSEEDAALFRRHERTGRPLGSERFVSRMERLLGRVHRPRKCGPKGP